MNWDKELLEEIRIGKIEHLEEKKKVAEKIADKVQDNQIIGFGSGSTSYLATIAIADKIKKENLQIVAIPTSFEIKMLCAYLEIPTTTLSEKKPDWSFDGADEVDKNNWLIKGKGGAMFKEKLNIVNSPITYILIDSSKKVKKLGEKNKVPVEIFPDAINYVKEERVAEVSRGDWEEGRERSEVLREEGLLPEGLDELGIEHADLGALGVEEIENGRERAKLVGLDAAHDQMNVRKGGLQKQIHREVRAELPV